jgi:hypothetical protein
VKKKLKAMATRQRRTLSNLIEVLPEKKLRVKRSFLHRREKVCRQKFSVFVGTIYQNTKIPLTKWFLATDIIAVDSKSISNLQIATWLGVTQKTSWHLQKR